MLKLSEYKTAFAFEGRAARNFADWLRADRETNPERIDGEIAYDAEMVRNSLRKRIKTIEKKYPDNLEAVSQFVNGCQLNEIKHEQTETEPESAEPTELETASETAAEDTPENDGTNIAVDQLVGMDQDPEPIDPQPETVATNSAIPNTPEQTELNTKASRLRTILTNPETMLFGTVAVIFVFLPFTVLNLHQYISIETETVFGSWMIWFLCFGIAFVWDFSILLFAVNGKHRISQIGAGVLFVFMASKFDFFKRIFDLFGADGDWWQLMFVLSAIVFYSPVLIHQYTKLATNEP